MIRGGRTTEAAVYLDGMLLSDYARQTLSARPGIFALEQVDVLTGAFGAGFGHAQSGIVNLVTRSESDRWNGQVRLTLDPHPGTDGYDDGEREAFAREPCCGYRALQGSLSGPLGTDRLGLFGSLELIRTADARPRSAGFNPAAGRFNSSGSTETILPGNRANRIHSMLKLTGRPWDGARASGTWLFGREQDEQYDASKGVNQYLSSSGVRLVSHDLLARWDQEVFRSPVRDLRFSLSTHFHATEIGRGTPRSARMAAVLAGQLGDACGAECVVGEDPFTGDLLGFDLDELTFFFEDSAPGRVPGTRFPGSAEPDPIFGLRGVFSTVDGFEPFYARRDERRWGIRAEVDSQLNRHHRVKAGIEWTWIELDVRGRRLESEFDAEVYEVHPRTGAAWIQDRIDLGDLVLDLGLRWDRWDPNTLFPAVPRTLPCSVTPSPGTPCFTDVEGVEAVDAPVRDVLAPRIAVAHPVTDRTQVRLSYGQFFQLPELRRFFQNYNADEYVQGNPYLEHVQSTAFEVGITSLLDADTALDLVGYHRNREGAVRLDVVYAGTLAPFQRELAMFGNGDFGTVKGVEIVLRRRMSSYLAFDASWALQWARGTTSSPTSFFRTLGQLRDPLNPERFLTPPTDLSPEDFDRLHDIAARVQVRLPRDFRAGTPLGRILGDVGGSFVVEALSGQPYTRVSLFRGGHVEDINSSRKPWTVRTDLRLSKTVSLSDAVELSLFTTVFNVLGRRNVLGVHSTTGRPDRAGGEDLGPFPFPGDFVDDGGPPIEDWPLPLERVLPEHRDRAGLWDFDGDGLVTEAESAELVRRALIVGSDGPGFYGEPRLVRFGAEIRF